MYGIATVALEGFALFDAASTLHVPAVPAPVTQQDFDFEVDEWAIIASSLFECIGMDMSYAYFLRGRMRWILAQEQFRRIATWHTNLQNDALVDLCHSRVLRVQALGLDSRAVGDNGSNPAAEMLRLITTRSPQVNLRPFRSPLTFVRDPDNTSIVWRGAATLRDRWGGEQAVVSFLRERSLRRPTRAMARLIEQRRQEAQSRTQLQERPENTDDLGVVNDPTSSQDVNKFAYQFEAIKHFSLVNASHSFW